MGLVNLKLSGIWFKQSFLEDNVHVELKFNILQSFSGIEQRRSISNFCLTRRVYRWTSTRSCDREAVSSNGTKIWIQMGYQSELSKCGGGSFRLQFKIGLVLSERKIKFWIAESGFRLVKRNDATYDTFHCAWFFFSGFISMGILLWLVLFGPVFVFKHLKRLLPAAYEWCVEKAKSLM